MDDSSDEDASAWVRPLPPHLREEQKLGRKRRRLEPLPSEAEAFQNEIMEELFADDTEPDLWEKLMGL